MKPSRSSDAFPKGRNTGSPTADPRKAEPVQRRIRWRENADRIILSLVLIAGITLPVIVFAIRDVSLTGIQEESVGYRYFYSLRILYSPERPWLPQGQLPGLTHLLIQSFLSAIGHSPTELFPRIDLFTTLASLSAGFVVGLAFFWTIAPVRTRASRTALTIFALVMIYSSRLPQGWMTLPDYYLWIFPVALVAGGWILRLLLGSTNYDSPSAAVLLGLFGGLSLAVKPSLLVFPLAVGSTFVALRLRPIFILRLAAISISITAAVWMTLITLYNLGDINALRTYFADLKIFIGSQSNTLPHQMSGLSTFAHEVMPKDAHDFFFLGPLLFLTLLSPLITRRNWPLLFLVPASLVAAYVCISRYYNFTLIETYAFMMMLIVIVLPYLFRSVNGRFWPVFSWCLAVMMIAYFAPGAWVESASYYRTASALDSASLKFHETLKTLGGLTAYLTPDNTFRPPSIDSAISKGGTDIFQSVWGVSPFIKSMFPDRWYFLYGGTADLKRFSNAVFIKLDGETLQSAKQRVETKFVTSLSAFDCAREIPAFGSSYIICHQDSSSAAEAH